MNASAAVAVYRGFYVPTKTASWLLEKLPQPPFEVVRLYPTGRRSFELVVGDRVIARFKNHATALKKQNEWNWALASVRFVGMR